jgi:hypothetical protein
MDAIQIDDGVQGFQRAGLPSLDVLDDRVSAVEMSVGERTSMTRFCPSDSSYPPD